MLLVLDVLLIVFYYLVLTVFSVYLSYSMCVTMSISIRLYPNLDLWNANILHYITYDMIYEYLLTAIALSPSGSSTVHIYTQTIHRTTKIITNLKDCGPGPVFVSFTMAFALQLRKKR